MVQFEVEVALLGLFGSLDLVDDHRKGVFRVVRHGVEQIKGQPFRREVEILPVGRREAGAVAALPVQLLLRRDDRGGTGVDLLGAVEADVVVVVGNPFEQVEIDDGPFPLLGLEGGGFLARVERLAVVAFEVILLVAERMHGGYQSVNIRIISVVVVAGGERQGEERRQKEQTDFFHDFRILLLPFASENARKAGILHGAEIFSVRMQYFVVRTIYIGEFSDADG